MVSNNQTSAFVLHNHISVKAASMFSGYSLQYLRRLLRKGILSGIKIGQLWLIDKSIFDIYLENAKSVRDQRFGPQGRVQ